MKQPIENRKPIGISTTWGRVVVEQEDGYAVRCTLPFLDAPPDRPFSVTEDAADRTSRLVIAVLTGKAPQESIPVRMQGTPFQKAVWDAISEIPAGETITYGVLARAIGRPRAYRAVANACGRNPVPLFIPCHRVVGANGKPGGFSAGMAWKRMLLDVERPAQI